jgi:hypothetical protein
MKDYRIEYQDKDQNELFIGILTAVDLQDATDYANKLMAETKLNDLYTFVITEIITMKNLINYFTPVTDEHKSFLRHFLGTLTMFLVLGGMFYCLMYLKAL